MNLSLRFPDSTGHLTDPTNKRETSSTAQTLKNHSSIWGTFCMIFNIWVGPLTKTRSGNHCPLIWMELSHSIPEAISWSNITAKRIAEELLTFIYELWITHINTIRSKVFFFIPELFKEIMDRTENIEQYSTEQALRPTMLCRALSENQDQVIPLPIILVCSVVPIQ